MNAQLPPIDPELREQLARRSAGRPPEGLLSEVTKALDAVPASRPGPGWPAVAWRAPRLAAAGAGLALVAILAVALAVPAFHSTPADSFAGYPAQRALTTAELASLLAGPALAADTTVVASVTIDIRSDVCQLDSRPTVGVIEGMGSQVCVMASSRPTALVGPKATGVFAFRYMAPGYLGLIDQLAAGPSGLAFKVADDWPLDGKAFLVDGYLGATPLHCVATEKYEYGDFLNPAGYENCELSWLSSDGSPAPVQLDQASASPGSSLPRVAYPNASSDLLALHNHARYVAAGGARQIDSIPLETTRGVYVVRPGTGPCPDASPVDSRGCTTWQVLARVAPISATQPSPIATPVATPTATPTGPATPIAEYPAGRALTTAELAALMAGPALPTNTALVAAVTIEARTDVCPMNRYPTVGIVQGMGSQVCVMGAGVSAYLTTASETGTFAFRYLAPGYLGLVGEITPASASKITFAIADDWPTGRQTFLVSGWLGAVETTASCIEPTPGDVLYPNGNDCQFGDWLGDGSAAPGIEADFTENQDPPPTYDPGALRGNARHVGAGGMRVFDAIDPRAPVHGVYVVRADTSACPNPSAADVSGCATWLVLARIADTPGAPPAATPTPAATATPGATPAPTPHVLPTGAAGAAPIGLIAPDNLPLTEGVFATLWAADPAHLAGRIVVVKGPVPTGFMCWDAGAADASAPPGTCHVAIRDGFIGADGHYWVVQVGTEGTLSVVGELTTPQDSFVFTVEQALTSKTEPGRHFLIVDAWLDWGNPCDTLPTEPPGSACGYSLLSSKELSWGHMPTLLPEGAVVYGVQADAYFLFSTDASGWQASHGLYLLESTSVSASILARLEPATP